MAHSSVVLDQRSPKKDNTVPVKIRITHKGEFYIGTNIDLFTSQWIEIADSSSLKSKTGVVVNHPLASRLNNIITARKLSIDKKLLDLAESGKLATMDNAALKVFLLSEYSKPAAYLFKEHYDKFCSGKTKSSTLDILKTTLSNITKFTDIENLSFLDMNYEWVKRFDKFLSEKGVSVNGRAVYMRNIRSVFNDAIKCDKVDLSSYPFRKFTIKSEKTRKRSLTVEQLRELRDYPCEKHLEKYRDMFMLIFYLHGINLIDLAQLKEIKNGRIEFRRSKTGRQYSIKVEPEAMQIIERYRGQNFLLNILDKYSDHKDFMRRMNRGLSRIGVMELIENAAKNPKDVKKNKKQITPAFAGLTSYWARHTIATIAAKTGVTKDTIAAMLGHGATITDIYIAYDLQLVDAANRKVIDFVNQYTSTNE